MTPGDVPRVINVGPLEGETGNDILKKEIVRDISELIQKREEKLESFLSSHLSDIRGQLKTQSERLDEMKTVAERRKSTQDQTNREIRLEILAANAELANWVSDQIGGSLKAYARYQRSEEGKDLNRSIPYSPGKAKRQRKTRDPERSPSEEEGAGQSEETPMSSTLEQGDQEKSIQEVIERGRELRSLPEFISRHQSPSRLNRPSFAGRPRTEASPARRLPQLPFLPSIIPTGLTKQTPEQGEAKSLRYPMNQHHQHRPEQGTVIKVMLNQEGP